MKQPARVLLCPLIAVFAAASLLQAQAVDAGVQVGVLDDGRAVLGGQLGAAVTRDIRVSGGIISVRGLGSDASLTEVELALRWAVTTSSSIRPYLISGLVLERSHVTDATSSDLGWVAGAGLGLGSGVVEPFLEIRALEDGGIFSIGLRVSTAPFRTSPRPRTDNRSSANRLTRT